MSGLKKIDLFAKTLVALKIQVPSIVDNYLGSKVRDVFQKELKKHIVDLVQKYSLQQIPELPKKQIPTVDIKQGSEKRSEKSALEILEIKREQDETQKILKFTIKSTDKAALEEYDLKSTLYQTMHKNKSFNRNLANHRLYHALIEALIVDENAMDKGGKKIKRRRTKESVSSKKPSTTKETLKGKALSKGSKTGKSAPTKEPVEEPIAELRVAKLEKDMSGLKKIDLFAKTLVALKIQVPSIIDNYLGSKVRDVFQKELKKHIVDLVQK
uniref:Uncharacterized protein n=1 Tax=Tanacetum cinerariifolium TaxID=118510 RepID=A0A6L2JCR9_TANCI|nr:hypothetical protein [Tanacetum cinerariifolium]